MMSKPGVVTPSFSACVPITKFYRKLLVALQPVAAAQLLGYPLHSAQHLVKRGKWTMQQARQLLLVGLLELDVRPPLPGNRPRRQSMVWFSIPVSGR